MAYTSYENLLSDVVNGLGEEVPTGTRLEDGTQPTALSMTGVQFRVDLGQGFPAVTTKKLQWGSVVKELLWFLRGEVNTATLGCKIWDEWAGKNGRALGDCGRIYGYQWRRQKHIVQIEPRRVTAAPPPQPPFFPIVGVEQGSEPHPRLGAMEMDKYGQPYRVIAVRRDEITKELRFDLQFLDTGYVAAGVDRNAFRCGRFCDRYAISVHGVGRLGRRLSVPELQRLRGRWSAMLDRCYNQASSSFPQYGGRGVVVDGHWHIFSNFVEDVQTLPGWNEFLATPGAYELDKDYFDGGCYSKETCSWLPRRDNRVYTRSLRPFLAVSPDGARYTAISASSFGTEMGIDPSCISRVLRGEWAQTNGWRFQPLPEGPIYREIEVDQVGELVRGLKAVAADPLDRRRRRLVVSAWNLGDIADMALPPCHTLFQVLPVNGRLDICCFWRSIDLFYGMPFNVASYALLCHILCAVSGLQPGSLVANIADAHVYANQVDAVREQIERTPLASPTLGVAAAVKELAPDLTVEQCRLLKPEMFWLENYRHHGPLESRPEIAV